MRKRPDPLTRPSRQDFAQILIARSAEVAPYAVMFFATPCALTHGRLRPATRPCPRVCRAYLHTRGHGRVAGRSLPCVSAHGVAKNMTAYGATSALRAMSIWAKSWRLGLVNGSGRFLIHIRREGNGGSSSSSTISEVLPDSPSVPSNHHH